MPVLLGGLKTDFSKSEPWGIECLHTEKPDIRNIFHKLICNIESINNLMIVNLIFDTKNLLTPGLTVQRSLLALKLANGEKAGYTFSAWMFWHPETRAFANAIFFDAVNAL